MPRRRSVVGDGAEAPVVLPERDFAVADLVHGDERQQSGLPGLPGPRRGVLVHHVGAIAQPQPVVVDVVDQLSSPTLSRFTMSSGPRAASVGPSGKST
jgi:hypothetical protein